METIFNQQEILLMTNTSFSKQQWCENTSTDNRKQLSQTEQLEEACWNGLLYEMFPGVIEKNKDGKNLFLWSVRHNAAALEIELSEGPARIDPAYAIDPYTFMEGKNYN